MENRLFLYIDVLGFSELIKDTTRVERLYGILDKAALHRDSNFRAIVFSDTIVVYHTHTNLTGTSKANELMFMIELTQELFRRLIGSGIFFRAIITEGFFNHKKLKNLEAFYGQALVDTYRAEKNVCGIGLFLDNKLRKFNLVFRWHVFSAPFDFIYLTHHCTILTPQAQDFLLPPDKFPVNALANLDFPLPAIALTASSTEFLIYPEILHFQEVHTHMNTHPDPKVRAKHLATWKMYCLGYPKLMKSLVEHAFEPEGLAELDWSEVKQRFQEEQNGQ